jgi:multiple sugar transport system permease protein
LTKWNLAGFQEFVGLDNYLDVARDRQFAGALLFTSGYTVVVTLATFLLGFGLALLVRSRQRRVVILRTMFYLPVVIGTATASFIFVWLFNDQVGPVNGLLRTLGLIKENVVWLADPQTAFVTIIVMMTWKNAGFSMILLLIGMQAIPDELYEAARVDGASAWAMLRRITVPLLLPTIALVTILLATEAYLAFDQFFIITHGGPNGATITPVFWIFNQTFLGFRFGYSAALSIVLLMLLVTLGAIQLRVLRRDLTEA